MRLTEDTQPSPPNSSNEQGIPRGLPGLCVQCDCAEGGPGAGLDNHRSDIYLCSHMLCSVSCIHAASDLDLFTDIGPVEAARRVREQIGYTPTIVR